jgi:hypothetical protein
MVTSPAPFRPFAAASNATATGRRGQAAMLAASGGPALLVALRRLASGTCNDTVCAVLCCTLQYCTML